MRWTWTPERVARAAEMVAAGATIQEAGATFGKTGLNQALRRAGIEARAPRCRLGLNNGYLVTRGADGRLVFVHRLLMEMHIGRRLRPGEIVHHRDGRKHHNAIENLELLPSVSAHMREHRPRPSGACVGCDSPADRRLRGVLYCRPCWSHAYRYHGADGKGACRRSKGRCRLSR